MEIILHEDRCAVRNLPEHVLIALNSENLLRSDQDKIDFCGIIVQKNRADVFLPRNSKVVPYNESKKNSASLIQAIHKYTFNKDRSSETDGLSEKIVGGSFLGLAFTLMNDYVEHGVYVKRTSDIRKNTGKTDWKRTINRIQCYPSNGSIIYLDTLGKKTTTYYDDEISRIHAEVIRELDNLIGWIFFDNNSNVSSELAAFKKPSGDSNFKIEMLVKELGNLYADRDMKLMMDLMSYLSGETGNSNSSIVIGISKFHSMWEHMIDSCMILKYNINTHLAKPCYKINGEYQIATQKGGRTDTVLRSPDKKTFGIIDAKYYGADNLVNLPGWPDLIKQFFYALALNDIYPEATVYNWFIFPGSKATVESVHLMSPATQSLQDYKYKPIQCEFIEPMLLIDHYIAGKKITWLSEKILHI